MKSPCQIREPDSRLMNQMPDTRYQMPDIRILLLVSEEQPGGLVGGRTLRLPTDIAHLNPWYAERGASAEFGIAVITLGPRLLDDLADLIV